MAYFDDATPLFPVYDDLNFTLHFLLEHGPDLGIFLSLPKTKLLALPSDAPLSVLSPFQTALALLNGQSSLVRGGIRFL